jgi:hypothetical protein
LKSTAAALPENPGAGVRVTSHKRQGSSSAAFALDAAGFATRDFFG